MQTVPAIIFIHSNIAKGNKDLHILTLPNGLPDSRTEGHDVYPIEVE